MSEFNNTPDLRRRRTLKLLTSALVSLIFEKPVSQITVKELVEKAEIARTTFYQNCLDMDDFIDRITDKILFEYLIKAKEAVQHFDNPMSKEGVLAHNLVYFNHIAENADFYRAMLSINGPSSFRNKMLSIGSDWVTSLYKSGISADLASNIANPKYTSRYDLNLIINAAVAMQIVTVEFWVRHDMNYSIEYLANYQTDFCMSLGSLSFPV
ncbi:MAG: hypothetical protein CVU91_12085 [Firmicutes bacterium HGW-Firmicutes-16]|nr:MAG: hypothetical protein CVU91_12085 [Firmicutes bacterium HGW-Firmicutes-16]